MIKLIVKCFIKDSENISEPEVRKSYGVLGGTIGIICNVLLFIVKLSVGVISGSISILSDAFNNLSDSGTAIVSAIGAYVGGKDADEEHPYGHGRAEYIASFIISLFVIIVGVELFEKSVKGIFVPTEVRITSGMLAVLIASILVKLWMWYVNRYLGKRVNSTILLVAAQDSLNDIISTAVVVFSSFMMRFTDFPIDAVAGILVSFMIIKSGIDIARDIIDRLMGRAPSNELIKNIEEMVLSGEYVIGMHDLMIHDYGPGRKVASVHAEVSDDLSLIQVHNMIDKIEHRILDELKVDIVIHMDPVKKTDRC